jgi:enamine deaminase RidA (YjgF/YER057c/UK114 family)
MSRSVHVPDGIFDSRDYGFAQVVTVPTPFGDAVHVSGQVAWSADRRIVGSGDIGRQLEQSLKNLAAALASVGATLDHVGALRLYIRQSHIHEGKAISAALKTAFGDNPPCATWIAVQSLANEEFLIEVEPSVVFLQQKQREK